MRLITEHGELELPKDYNITIKRTNPLLSGEGDASYPMTLPSTPNNLALIDHMERIDRSKRYMNKMEAILEVGPISKRGQLVIDTVKRRGGISAVFAIDNSDAYVKAKDKTLREIFKEYDDGAGYKIVFNDVDEAVELMQDVYSGKNEDQDFMVFPVAVSPYDEGEDDNKVTIYQYNNEDDGSGNLVYEERIVREGDIHMLVPKGYGIAPFLKLNALINRLFEAIGYTVTDNCFDNWPIVIVHNCADCLVRPELHYADLVPNCKLSEFLEWLLAKFHTQPVIDSQAKIARIVTMESVLYSNGIMDNSNDITNITVDDWEMQLSTSKRIILRPTNEIEGTEPAAETFNKLIEKYEYYMEADEDDWDTLAGQSPAFTDCLVLRKATGVFYLLERNMSTGEQELNRLGTNSFTYDRNNSDETEEFSQSDITPLMLCDKRAVAPFIGSRCHRHTSYNGKEEDQEQKIIAVQAATDSRFAYTTTGTTQDNIPFQTHSAHSFSFGMSNEWLYSTFWKRYNTLLLNNSVRLKGRVKYNIGKFLGMNMSELMMSGGRLLVPVSAEMQIGEKPQITETEFLLDFTGTDLDESLEVFDNFPNAGTNNLRWEIQSETDLATAYRIFCNKFAGWNQNPPLMQFIGATIEHDGSGSTIWLGVPKEPGEIREITIPITITLKVAINTVQNGVITSYFIRIYKPDGEYNEDGIQTSSHTYDWLHPNKTYRFEAV